MEVEFFLSDVAKITEQAVHFNVWIDALKCTSKGLGLVLAEIGHIEILSGRIGGVDAVEVDVSDRAQPAAR